MPGQRPTLVVNSSPLGDQIQSFVEESSGRSVRRCTYDECRQHLAWNKPGLLVLVAATPGDWAPVAGLVQETALRQSPLQVVVVSAADSGDGSDRVRLSVARLPWPASADALGDVVRAAPDGADGTPEEELADRLLALTPSLAPMADRLAAAAAHDLTILLTGETGTGKTFLARLVHDCSARRANRFLVVSCGTLSGNLIASEFFG
ncbi:MAG TPA: sigma 54-interacting transcriptional regulator, partial [Gemmataceae bacterium]